MKLKRLLKWTALALVVLLVLWLVYCTVIELTYGRRVRILKARMQAAGVSLDIDALAPPKVPWSQNAARWHRAAALALNEGETTSGPAERDPAYEAFSLPKMSGKQRSQIVAERRDQLRAVLDRNDLALRLAHEGARYPSGWTDLDYSDGYKMKLPHLAGLRRVARLLALESWMAAANGDAHQSLQSAWNIFRLRRSIADEPVLPSWLTGFTTDAIGFLTLQEVLAVNQPQRQDLLLLLAEIQQPHAEGLRRALMMEGAVNVQLFEQIRSQGYGAVLRTVTDRLPQIYVLTPFFHPRPVDEAFCLSQIEALLEASARVDSITVEELHRIESDMSFSEVRRIRAYLFFPVSRITLPLLPKSLLVAKRDLACHDLAQCGIAAELYRLDNGRYPASLDVLAPKYLTKLPQDTFSGKPLFFKSLPDGVLIYSVGPSGKDYGGADDQTWWQGVASKSPADNIAWRVQRTTAATKTP